jgi:hypothetical protein
MFFSSRIFLLIAITGILIYGCAGHGSLPTSPDEAVTVPEITGSADTASNSSENSHYLLAYGMIYVDVDNPDGPKIEIVPAREGEIHLNILKLLEDGPCTNCFKIVGFNFPQPGYLDVNIQIDHPFDDLLLSVFDVRGIMMFQGSHEFPVAGKSISDPALGDGALLNADGYTALYNGSTITAPVGDLQKYYPGNMATPTIPNADINGYNYFITDIPSNDRNAFFGDSSGVDVQTYSLKLPTGPFVLGYAVDANWWMPISQPVDDPITDFDTNANCPEAWKIVVTEEPIGEGLTDQGGSVNLIVDVYDWQGKTTYHEPVIECPELFDGALNATWDSDGADYARYEVTISNSKLAPAGTYKVLVVVEANENDPAAKPWLDLTAYQIRNADVITGPATSITVTAPNGGEQLKVSGSGEITWTSTGDVGDVQILLSSDSGVSYPFVLVNSTPNDGSYVVNQIPLSMLGSNLRITVRDFYDSNIHDESDADFSVVLPAIQVTSPNGSECFTAGYPLAITWVADPEISEVSILLSENSGADYWMLIVDVTPNDGEYILNSINSDFASEFCRIKVMDAIYPMQIFDESDADFVIILPEIQVTTPNGGESWTTGSTQTIAWTSDPIIENVEIYISLNSGVDYEYPPLAGPIPNIGSWQFDSIPTSFISPYCRIEVISIELPDARDESDEDFEILEATDSFQIEVTTTESPQDFICRFYGPSPLYVDWGDESSHYYNATVDVTHSYATAGVYKISMSGYVNYIDFFIFPDPGTGTPKLISAILTPIQGITGLNSATEMFKHCENIPSIPAGLFDQCPGITSFYDTFLACRKITSIPPGLFNAQTNVTNFYAVFDNCDLITEIPPGLFDNHPNNLNFAWLFAKCYNVQSIPVGLFDDHTKNTTFSYTFFRCYEITTIPANLFDNNTQVTSFSYCFYECTSLTSIPPLLFDKNTLVTTYANCFYNCTNLTGPSPTNSEGKKLWELSPAPDGTGCFFNCTNLSDYDSIPAGWK